jgi:hypothetical protein
MTTIVSVGDIWEYLPRATRYKVTGILKFKVNGKWEHSIRYQAVDLKNEVLPDSEEYGRTASDFVNSFIKEAA